MRRASIAARRDRRERGLTLVEVVLSSAVLSVLLLGLFSSMAHAMRMDQLSREREVASRTALQQIDDVVMAVSTEDDFDAMAALADQSFHVQFAGTGGAVNLPPAAVSPNPSSMAGLLAIEPVTAGTFDSIVHLVQATAKVRWRAADGSDQEVITVSWKVRPTDE